MQGKQTFRNVLISGNIVEVLKASQSDAIKKAASLFGIPCILN
jgi:hypothetical protein